MGIGKQIIKWLNPRRAQEGDELQALVQAALEKFTHPHHTQVMLHLVDGLLHKHCEPDADNVISRSVVESRIKGITLAVGTAFPCAWDIMWVHDDSKKEFQKLAHELQKHEFEKRSKELKKMEFRVFIGALKHHVGLDHPVRQAALETSRPKNGYTNPVALKKGEVCKATKYFLEDLGKIKAFFTPHPIGYYLMQDLVEYRMIECFLERNPQMKEFLPEENRLTKLATNIMAKYALIGAEEKEDKQLKKKLSKRFPWLAECQEKADATEVAEIVAKETAPPEEYKKWVAMTNDRYRQLRTQSPGGVDSRGATR